MNHKKIYYTVTGSHEKKPKYFMEYKSKSQKRKRNVYLVEFPKSAASKSSDTEYTHYNKLVLFQNQTDESNTFVAIKFYLPQSSKVKIILMDSDRNEAISFVEKEFEAGFHSFITDLRIDELRVFNYYYKLQTEEFSEVREMECNNRSDAHRAD